MALALPFEGLPPIWQLLFSASFVVIVLMLVWTTLLFVKAQRARRRPPSAPADGADAYTWVFLVPALNEEVTIADSVGRLSAVPVAEGHIVVIDDGSGASHRTRARARRRRSTTPTSGSASCSARTSTATA
jgi:1,2-diacylglycerol 3-beta-glucosyltransferase